jgi:hypothetical protein
MPSSIELNHIKPLQVAQIVGAIKAEEVDGKRILDLAVAEEIWFQIRFDQFIGVLEARIATAHRGGDRQPLHQNYSHIKAGYQLKLRSMLEELRRSQVQVEHGHIHYGDRESAEPAPPPIVGHKRRGGSTAAGQPRTRRNDHGQAGGGCNAVGLGGGASGASMDGDDSAAERGSLDSRQEAGRKTWSSEQVCFGCICL